MPPPIAFSSSALGASWHASPQKSDSSISIFRVFYLTMIQCLSGRPCPPTIVLSGLVYIPIIPSFLPQALAVVYVRTTPDARRNHQQGARPSQPQASRTTNGKSTGPSRHEGTEGAGDGGDDDDDERRPGRPDELPCRPQVKSETAPERNRSVMHESTDAAVDKWSTEEAREGAQNR